MNPAVAGDLPLEIKTVEQNQRRILFINRFLVGVLLLMIFVFSGDLVQWWMSLQHSFAPLKPSLIQLRASLEPIPPLALPETLFQVEKPPQQGKVEKTPQVMPEAQWKVVGISMGRTKRAFLQDLEGKKSVWVSEGEQLGPYRVREIRDHSIVLESEGNSYEIRM